MTIQEIIAQAEQVRTNIVPNSNTAELVGGVIKELALAHKDVADKIQGSVVKRIELVCDDTKIMLKGSDVALNYVQVKKLVDNPEFFVTLNYLGLFWMLPAYDDGGAIMFSSADILGGHVVVTRVIMNNASELNNYSIIAEDVEHKVDDLSKEVALDGHSNYPSCLGVNNALSELTARGWVKLADIDGMTNAKDVGVYNLMSGNKSSIYGLLIVTRNYAGWQTQYYIGNLIPSEGWRGNAEYKRIYARGCYEETWSDWSFIAGENFGDMEGKLSELAQEVGNIHPVTDEAGYHVVDADGNIGMQYTEQGFGAAKVQPQFVEVLKQAGVATGSALDAVSAEVEETGFFFVDEQLNVGVRVDSDGIHAKNILEYEIINE